MSSLPGYRLEEYLGWAYNLVIEDSIENNMSLGLAEALGGATTNRPVLTKAQFAPIVQMFEEHREGIERRLSDFDEDNQSWRDYAGVVFGFIPEELDKKVFSYLKTITDPEVPNSEVMSKQEMVLFLFKNGADFSNHRSVISPDVIAPLSIGWCWKKKPNEDMFEAVRGDGQTVTKKDVEEFIQGMFKSYTALHSKPAFNPIPTEAPMEYITKKDLADIRPYVTLPKVIKGLCDSVAMVASHANFNGSEQGQMAMAHLFNTLRSISTSFVPNNLDYITGKGPMARYLREHLAVEMLFENVDGSHPISLGNIRKEIDEKFNLKPNLRLDSIEWKNIIISIIELQARFFAPDDVTYDSLWKPVQPNQPITESGLYLYDNDQKVINLVFKVDEIPVTITVMADKDPLVNVYHEWEEVNINVYGFCFFNGMFKAMTEEIEKLTVVK